WWLRTRTRIQLLLAAAVAAVAVAGVAGPGVYLLRERHRESLRAHFWRQFDNSLQLGSLEKAEAALAALQGMSPGDPVIAQRVNDLRSRPAPPGDTKLIRFLMRLHVNEGHLDRAAREAAKLVEVAAYDW